MEIVEIDVEDGKGIIEAVVTGEHFEAERLRRYHTWALKADQDRETLMDEVNRLNDRILDLERATGQSI